MGRNEGSGEGGRVALGRVLVSIWRRQEREMSEQERGLQEVHFRQGGDWSMLDPLALLTGHFGFLK